MAAVEVKILRKQGLKQRRPSNKPAAEPPLRDRLVVELERLLPADAFAIALEDESSSFDKVRMRGLPAILIVHRGRALGLELPRAGHALSDAQRAVFPRLTQAGMRIEVARSFGEALTRLREMGLEVAAKDNLTRQVAELFRAAQGKAKRGEP